MIEHLPEEWCKCLLKLETPWRICTSLDGVYYIQTQHTHFNDCLQVMPESVLNTDYWHESNMFFFIKKRYNFL